MHNQSVRLFLYSSLAIAALTLVWGLRSIPKQGALAEQHLRSSLEQELILLSGAVKSATNAMKYRLLDVLKSEGNERSTRAFQDSPFTAAALLEWDGGQWRMLWNSSKMKDQFQPASLRQWMADWPLAKISNDEAFFAKIADVGGTPYFALVAPVRRPSNTPMLGIGLFPAGQFGLTFSADQAREIRVFDSKGFALALGRPAYLGASLKREPIVSEILDGDSLSLREEWKSERGIAMLGLVTRVSDSNLFAAVETELPLGRASMIQAWLYLLLTGAGAVALNWLLFSSMVRPLLGELAQAEEGLESMRRQMSEGGFSRLAPEIPAPEAAIPSARLPSVSFLERDPSVHPAGEAQAEERGPDNLQPPEPQPTPLGKVIGAALRTLDPRVKEAGITVNKVGLEDVSVTADVLQLQTAIEEVLKNAIEAMANADEKQLTITATVAGGRLVLTVEDTGCGIAEENMKNVFDPFFSTKDSQGVARGLGLNVVRRVVEEFFGSVTVRNRMSGKGVLVEISWPVDIGRDETPAPPASPPEPARDRFALDLLENELDDAEIEGFRTVQVGGKNWPGVRVRKPKVRTLD